jgi:hypothetical protein
MLYAEVGDGGDVEDGGMNKEDGEGGKTMERRRGVLYTQVVEVIKDMTPDYDAWSDLDFLNQLRGHDPISSKPRRAKQSRVGRWAPFELSADGTGLVDAFSAAGGSAGARMGGLGQMHVVKQFPFGRRA